MAAQQVPRLRPVSQIPEAGTGVAWIGGAPCKQEDQQTNGNLWPG